MATMTKAPAGPGGQKTFDYSVPDRSGKLITGQLEAADAQAVVSRLKSQGMAPVSVKSPPPARA